MPKFVTSRGSQSVEARDSGAECFRDCRFARWPLTEWTRPAQNGLLNLRGAFCLTLAQPSVSNPNSNCVSEGAELKSRIKRLLCSMPLIMLVAFALRLAIYYPSWQQTYSGSCSTNFPYGAETGRWPRPLPRDADSVRRCGWCKRVRRPGLLRFSRICWPGFSSCSGIQLHVESHHSHFRFRVFGADCWPIACIAKRDIRPEDGHCARPGCGYFCRRRFSFRSYGCGTRRWRHCGWQGWLRRR